MVLFRDYTVSFLPPGDHMKSLPVQTFPLDKETADLIDGDGGDNTLIGTGSADTMHGFGGNDFAFGYGGADTLYGGDGNDGLFGGQDFDTLYGGDGDDTLQGVEIGVLLTTSGPSDIIVGGAGIDLLAVNYAGFVNSGTGQPVSVTLDISTGSGEVQVDGFRGENFSQIERLSFSGPDGNDHVTGGKYNDSIDGAGGNDILRAGKGDDSVIDSWGVIDADGGDGVDTLTLIRNASHYDTGDAVIDGNAGTITVGGVDMGTFANFENLTVYTGYGNDTVVGIVDGVNVITADTGIFGVDAGNKIFYGQNMNDRLTSGLGDDVLYGGGGDDSMVGYGGTNTLYGGDGNDGITVVSVGGTDFVYGGSGNDHVNVGGQGATVDGGDGDDVLFLYEPYTASAGTEAYHGGSGQDILLLYWQDADLDFSGTAIDGFEELQFADYGNPCDLGMTFTTDQFLAFDIVRLGTENRYDDSFRIVLADNADVVLHEISQFMELVLADGGQLADLSGVGTDWVPYVTGGNGDDTVIAPTFAAVSLFVANLGGGDDRFTGGVIKDHVHGGSGNDTIDGGGGNDVVHATDDVLFGDAGNDKLDGGNRNDKLYGGTGKDSIKGGNGDDAIDGGTGADNLNGGRGLDKFVYAGAGDSTGAAFDIVTGCDFAGVDSFDLALAVTGIDAEIDAGQLRKGHFDTDLANVVDDAHLAAGHAVLFTPTQGNESGKTFLIVDVNGVAGYQANADLVVMLNNAANLGGLDTTDFI